MVTWEDGICLSEAGPIVEASGAHLPEVGVPSNSILNPEILLSGKPPETERLVFEKKVGWKEWGSNP